ECEKNLEIARKLDPQTSLGGMTYLLLSDVAYRKGNIPQFYDYLSLSFLLPQEGRQGQKGNELMQLTVDDRFLPAVLEYAEKSNLSIDDWTSAMINFYVNLRNLDKTTSAERLVLKVLEKRKEMYPEDVDDWCLFLTFMYADNSQQDRIPP